MTNENETPESIIISLGRHISLGDYCNTETKLYRVSLIDPESQLRSLDILRIHLNNWERQERSNFLEMQNQKREDEIALDEKNRLKRDAKDAETRKEILDFVEANPKCTMDSLVLTFQLSQLAIQQHIEHLVRQGKIARAECRESFIRRVIEDPRDELEDDEQQ